MKLHAPHWKTCVAAALLLASGTNSSFAAPESRHPNWLPSAVIYCIYPEIFSTAGFKGIEQQLPRLNSLGVSVLWLMPVTPVGLPFNGHPAIDSPYAVRDYYAVNPRYGTSADLAHLVQSAHTLGMKVILDEVLNHTSWDNSLTTKHPEFYQHTDGNPRNPGSEEQAFNFRDVAQLDYSRPSSGLWTYMDGMLNHWLTTYNLDGFRFDTADDPFGANRKIPKPFWQQLKISLEAKKPGILMLGEEEDSELALAPFELDYGWKLQKSLAQIANGGSISNLQSTWLAQTTNVPTGMLHMSLLQDWDLGEDLQVYGGPLNTLDVAVFNFTLNGVPLLFNGEEAGNEASGNNTHTLVRWNSPRAAQFTAFYTQLIALRNANPALQQGALTWESNSAPSQVATFLRASGNSEFFVEINFSNVAAHGTVALPGGAAWKDVTPSGSPGKQKHIAPGELSLLPHDFAIFRRSAHEPEHRLICGARAMKAGVS